MHHFAGIPLAQIPHEWAPFEPDNKNNAESCLALRSDGKFADVRCDEPRPYICYREHSNVDINVCGTPDPGNILKFFNIMFNVLLSFIINLLKFPRLPF